MNHQIRAGYFARVGALSLAALVAGCGGTSDEAAAAKAARVEAAAKQSAAAQEGTLPGDERLANAVVVTGKSSAPVDLKYDIAVKPVVGQPFEVELTFVPRVAADSLLVEFSAVEGLTLVGEPALNFEKVRAGERYTAKVVGQSEVAGMYYIGVSAQMSTKIQTEMRGFSVPVVVGTPTADEKPAPQLDASGEAVQPMPATEPAR